MGLQQLVAVVIPRLAIVGIFGIVRHQLPRNSVARPLARRIKLDWLEQKGQLPQLTSLDIFDITQRPRLLPAQMVPTAIIVATSVPAPTNPNISDTVQLHLRQLVQDPLAKATLLAVSIVGFTGVNFGKLHHLKPEFPGPVLAPLVVDRLVAFTLDLANPNISDITPQLHRRQVALLPSVAVLASALLPEVAESAEECFATGSETLASLGYHPMSSFKLLGMRYPSHQLQVVPKRQKLKVKYLLSCTCVWFVCLD